MSEPSGEQIQAHAPGTGRLRTSNRSSSTVTMPGPSGCPITARLFLGAKQSELFLGDLRKYRGEGNLYYFGHFIAEDVREHWEIVDGQQRITTFVLFLMVCRVLSPSGAHASAYSMIEQFHGELRW